MAGLVHSTGPFPRPIVRLSRPAALRIRHYRAQRASTVELARSDSSLLTELQLGAYFHGFWRMRVVRRAGAVVRSLVTRQ